MSLSLDFLGAQRDYFAKASWQVYCNTGSGYQYVGKTNNSVELDMGIENIEWFENGSGVQVLYLLTQTKIDPKINFSFMQVWDPNVFPLVANLERDNSSVGYEYAFIGSDPEDYTYFPWKFVTKSLGGEQAEIFVRSGVCSINGTVTLGEPGNLGMVPATIRMTQDTSITNTRRDLGYFRVAKRPTS